MLYFDRQRDKPPVAYMMEECLHCGRRYKYRGMVDRVHHRPYSECETADEERQRHARER